VGKSGVRFYKVILPFEQKTVVFGRRHIGLKAILTPPSKRDSEYFDPCQEAASRSMRCLHRNGGDRDLCTDYFQ
jgi:hypothetical protein